MILFNNDKMLFTQRAQQGRQGGCGMHLCHNLTMGSHVVHKAARFSVRSVYRTQETPRLWQQLTHRCGPHLSEAGSSVHAPEMRQVTDEVQLIRYDTQSGVLQQAQTLG